MGGLEHPVGLLRASIRVPAGVRADSCCVPLGLCSELKLVICLLPGVGADLLRLSLRLNSELAAERVLLVEALANEIVEAAERKPARDVLQVLADSCAVVPMKRPRKITHNEMAERDLRVGELFLDRRLAPIIVPCG